MLTFNTFKTALNAISLQFDALKKSFDGIVERLSSTEAAIPAPDWDESDPESKNYVKNRTHYIKKDGTVVRLPTLYIPDEVSMKTDMVVNKGSGDYSTVQGQGTTASGYASHAEGYCTTASASYSHAEGQNTTASKNWSHAEGGSTTASGAYSHAEGNSTNASGACSHAEGYTTTASGSYSHAEGSFTEASGGYSHAEGFYTKASSSYQHVQGKYNVADTTGKYAHIVGNGASDSARSNAHTLDWKGNAWFAGTVEGTKLILKSVTSGSTKRFEITVDDSGAISAKEITS